MNSSLDQLRAVLTSNGPVNDSENLWTTKDVAKFLHVSTKTVFELRKRGLPYLKLGGACASFPRKSGITS